MRSLVCSPRFHPHITLSCFGQWVTLPGSPWRVQLLPGGKLLFIDEQGQETRFALMGPILKEQKAYLDLKRRQLIWELHSGSDTHFMSFARLAIEGTQIPTIQLLKWKGALPGLACSLNGNPSTLNPRTLLTIFSHSSTPSINNPSLTKGPLVEWWAGSDRRSTWEGLLTDPHPWALAHHLLLALRWLPIPEPTVQVQVDRLLAHDLWWKTWRDELNQHCIGPFTLLTPYLSHQAQEWFSALSYAFLRRWWQQTTSQASSSLRWTLNAAAATTIPSGRLRIHDSGLQLEGMWRAGRWRQLTLLSTLDQTLVLQLKPPPRSLRIQRALGGVALQEGSLQLDLKAGVLFRLDKLLY